MRLSRTLQLSGRVIAVVGILGASTFFGAASGASHEIVFTECDAEPTPTPGASATPTPAPTPATTPVAGRTPSPQNCIPPSGDRIWGRRTLAFETNDSFPTSVQEVRLFIFADESGLPNPNGSKALATWPRRTTPYTYEWDSLVTTPRNGRYKVRVEAVGDPHPTGSPTATEERADLRVDNPPNPVGMPTILARSIASVTIQWPKAKEPDVISYTIYRAMTSGKAQKPAYSSFKQVGVTTGTTFRDGEVKPGFNWYTVRVTRRSVVTPATGIASTFSDISPPAEVKSIQDLQERPKGSGPVPTRVIAKRPVAAPPVQSTVQSVPDSPFKYKLPYDAPDGTVGSVVEEGSSGSGGGVIDPRGAVLPVAVGMFLVSSALAVGRMPY